MAFGELSLPGQMYRTLCQDPGCRAPLGGMHIPCGGGLVVFHCHACGSSSAFENTAVGYKTKNLGHRDGHHLPNQLYRALCQNPACHEPVGALHIPCGGGLVVYGCHKCGTISSFQNTDTGYVVQMAGAMKQHAPKSQPAARSSDFIVRPRMRR